MNYTEMASTLEVQLQDLNEGISKVKNTDMEPIWTGDVSLSLLEEHKKYVEKLEIERQNLAELITALKMLEQYKGTKKEIENLNNTLSNYPATSENANAINTINSEISRLSNNNSILKGTIIDILDGISSISCENQIITSYITPYANEGELEQ